MLNKVSKNIQLLVLVWLLNDPSTQEVIGANTRCGCSLTSYPGRKNIQLPLQKFPGEIHVPGMNFAGPGTRLDHRLNDDGTPKSWSQPVDRVDQAAYYHDLAYYENKDIENRNIADREMLQQLDSIKNPSFRAKIEMAIIRPIIYNKQRFRLGLKDRSAQGFTLVASRRSKR
jgi:Phospholipase A2-like domain